MLTTLLGEEVYRLRPGEAVDSMGDTVRTWETPARKLIPGATVEPVSSTGADGTVYVIESKRRLLIASAFDIKATDRVEYGGEVWRVDGTPRVVRGLIVGTHTAVKLTRYETR